MGDRAPIFDEDGPDINGTTNPYPKYAPNPTTPLERLRNTLSIRHVVIAVVCFIAFVLYIDLKSTQNADHRSHLNDRKEMLGTIDRLKESLRKSCTRVMFSRSEDKPKKDGIININSPLGQYGSLSLCGGWQVGSRPDLRIDFLNATGDMIAYSKVDINTRSIMTYVEDEKPFDLSEGFEAYPPEEVICVKYATARENDLLFHVANVEETKYGLMSFSKTVKVADIAKIRVGKRWILHNVTQSFCDLDYL